MAMSAPHIAARREMKKADVHVDSLPIVESFRHRSA